MPRRSPPTALRLVSGPTPPRNTPKHAMPSPPRPAFQPPAFVTKGAASRPRDPVVQTPDFLNSFLPGGSGPAILSASSLEVDPSTPRSRAGPGTGKFVRGPWDHSGSISVPINIETVLTPLQPAAMVGV